MSRKDHVLLAAVIQQHVTDADGDAATLLTIARLASSLADVLAQDNPSFDRLRFAAACGLTF